MSWVALLEQINVMWHQVFVVLNNHKSSLYWCVVSISIWRRARTAQLPFQRQVRVVSFGLTDYKECLQRSEWVSEWVSDTFAYRSPSKKLVSTLCVSTSLKTDLIPWKISPTSPITPISGEVTSLFLRHKSMASLRSKL